MARNWIVVGDAAEGGGQVLTGSPYTDIDGKAVARIGDKAQCRRHGGVFAIATGDDSIVIDGQPVARQGDRLACGCSLLAVQQNLVYVETAYGTGANTAPVGWPDDAVSAGLQALPPTWQPAFDQALRFVGPTGAPLAGVDYLLTLEDGTEHHGVTDSDGTTERIGTDVCTAICSAVLTAPEGDDEGCCARDGEPDSVTVSLEDVATTSQDVGTSVTEVKTKRIKRRMTQGEIEMARTVFKDSIDYSKVWIHNRGYWLLFGLQDEDTAVAPNGQIYMGEKMFEADYSNPESTRQAHFIHEMTHVWQHQLGYPIRRKRVLKMDMSYMYKIEDDSLLSSFNMEEQGDILADYFLRMKYPTGKPVGGSLRIVYYTIQDYERILGEFTDDPGAKSNLPAN